MQRTTTSLIALALAASVSLPALAQGSATGKTRDQVRAELIEAQRSGNLVVNGETGETARDLRPDLYPTVSGGQGKTRADVRAELIEAQSQPQSDLYFGD